MTPETGIWVLLGLFALNCAAIWFSSRFQEKQLERFQKVHDRLSELVRDPIKLETEVAELSEDDLNRLIERLQVRGALMMPPPEQEPGPWTAPGNRDDQQPPNECTITTWSKDAVEELRLAKEQTKRLEERDQ